MDDTDLAILAAIKAGDRTAAQILAALEKAGTPISQPTLSRRLSALQGERRIVVRGKGRSTTYEPDNYNEYFDVPAERRKPVGYDRSVLESYVPNEMLPRPIESPLNAITRV